MKQYILLSYLILLLVFTGCNNPVQAPKLNPENFAGEIDGKPVNLYLLTNKNGMEMTVCNYGAKVVSFYVKDKNNNSDDIILGYDSLADYLNPIKKMTGSVVGRVAGRISGGQFEIDGNAYKLRQVNERNFHSHGGYKGFDKVVWDVLEHNKNSITLQYTSADGEEGYPGTLKTIMKYELTDENIFRITYDATTDKPTLVNLTHHSFFNLAGAGNGNVENHILEINSAAYLPILPTTINTGEINTVAGTPFDFRTYKRVGDGINSSFPQIQYAKGYDHTWVIDKKGGEELSFAAGIYDPNSGRKMDVFTNQPCLHFYTSKSSSPKTGKGGKEYGNRAGFCMETMHYPDGINQPAFPAYILRAGETYYHICEFRFSIIE
ncbi:aldose epimerase family protein [Paludibacter sp. 221]|uniref:aldose epimerase family protein n=1 Tax=Paludibacter sp. 221 TaxID=2302939 RepID=UPI0013D6B92F|nr:aldose epimerase family protein [Paludibacter sp. 221]